MSGRPRLRRGAYSREEQLLSRPRTETTREREVFRLLHPWTSTFKPVSLERPAFPHDHASPLPEPVGCPDIALSAFAQLGALRLNAHRCIISLLSSNVEYVLAESTKTLSLQYDTTGTSNDALWVGTSSFLRDEGLSSLALDDWHKARDFRENPETIEHYYTASQSPHWLIISDTRTRPELQERQYVKRGHVRFFCSVPIRGHQGTVIGSYAVLDDKPRYGVSTDEMNFLEDMADTVTHHLDSTKTRAQRQRSERLIKGLGLFNTGRESLRDWWLGQDDRQNRRGRRYMETNTDEDKMRQERLDEEFGINERVGESARSLREKERLASTETTQEKKTTSVVARSNSAAVGDRNSMKVSSEDFCPPPGVQILDEPSSPESSMKISSRHGNSRRRKPALSKEFDLSREIDSVYARASNLMREAIGAEGVLFLDANLPGTAKHRSRSGLEPYNPVTAEHGRVSSAYQSGAETQLHESDSDSAPTSATASQPCDLLGFSTRVRSSLGGFLPSKKQLSLPKDFLERLILHYPRGKVFNYAESGGMHSSSGGEGSSTSEGPSTRGRSRKRGRKMTTIAQEAAMLSDILSGVRTVAFLPLWDPNRERWRAGALVWSTAPLRYFDPEEDLTYLAAFGNSVVAELAHLDAISANTAKTTFMASISHELRSPLHGVLAGVEFLQDSQLTQEQQEMTTTISVAGQTLLDTIDHILDYSKMNNFTGAQKKERAATDAVRHKNSGKGDDSEIGVTANVDFAKLTEDVIETVVAANRFQTMTRRAEVADSNPRRQLHRTASNSSDSPVSLVVDIPWRARWWVAMQPGSWTRILANLLGNSLKYTKEGLISIKLHAGNAVGLSQGYEHIPVTLTIEDTGIGMTSSWLEKDLYTPFKQVDSHSNGIGLGLSIVKQIVQEIGGTIMFDSEIGKGTKVVVEFTAKFLAESSLPDRSKSDTDSLAALKVLKGKRLHLLTPRDDEDKGAVDIAMMNSSLATACSDWLNVHISSGPSAKEDHSADVYAIIEAELPEGSSGRKILPESLYPPVKDGYRPPLVIFGSSLRSNIDSVLIRDETLEMFFISQPIGPRKLARVLIAGTTGADMMTTPLTEATDFPFVSTSTWDDQGSPGSTTLQGAVTGEIRCLPKPKDADSSPVKEGRPAAKRQEFEGSRRLRPSFARRHTQAQQALPVTILPPSTLRASSWAAEGQMAMIDAVHESLDRRTILLVEDNSINMKLLAALMRRLKYPYVMAENGLIALERYSEAPHIFLCAFMDLNMPIMDGFRATEMIRELEKKDKLTRLNIVALTGVASTTARNNAFASGVDEFMTKPISMKAIKAVVQDIQDAAEGS